MAGKGRTALPHLDYPDEGETTYEAPKRQSWKAIQRGRAKEQRELQAVRQRQAESSKETPVQQIPDQAQAGTPRQVQQTSMQTAHAPAKQAQATTQAKQVQVPLASQQTVPKQAQPGTSKQAQELLRILNTQKAQQKAPKQKQATPPAQATSPKQVTSQKQAAPTKQAEPKQVPQMPKQAVLIRPQVEVSAQMPYATQDLETDSVFDEHFNILGIGKEAAPSRAEVEEVRTTPLLSLATRKETAKHGSDNAPLFPQFALLAGVIGLRQEKPKVQLVPYSDWWDAAPRRTTDDDPRIFQNINAPWSAFICGSQGSGKSHTVSCMLENCLVRNNRLGPLLNPLAGLVFHHDLFASSFGGQVCEAAYLCTAGISVTVLVSPSNLERMRILYRNMPGVSLESKKPIVEPLVLDEAYLNVDRLLGLMAAGDSEGPMPLYMQSVLQVLREMAMKNQSRPGIDYAEFKKQILRKPLTPAQLGPLLIRLDLLESFIGKPDKNNQIRGNNWTPVPGRLVVVDLSCPFVDPATACGLFDICLGVFLEQDSKIGRVVALDEAHKYMNQSSAAQKLTQSLETVIRLQRHLAVRIIIATQEPTISSTLLDLCSITIVHRFTSPEWYKTLKGHLAAVSIATDMERKDEVFNDIARLNVGEALLFSPSAMLDVETDIDRDGSSSSRVQKLGTEFLKIRVRTKATVDGGKSVLAV